jgi:hypothetical protein
MRKLMIAGAWGAMTRKALVEVLPCSDSSWHSPAAPAMYQMSLAGHPKGYEHRPMAPGDLPGH